MLGSLKGGGRRRAGATCLGRQADFTNKVSSRFEGALCEVLLGVLKGSPGS